MLVLEHPQKTPGFHEMAGKRTSSIEGYFLRFFENYDYIQESVLRFFLEICDKYIKIGPFDFLKSQVCILIAALMTFSYLMPYF